MNIALWLVRTAENHPDLPAVAHGTETVSNYRELGQTVAQLASSLANRLEVRPGDRVAIAAKNVPDYVAALHAIWHAGAVAVPLNAKLHAQEIAYAIEHSGACVVFASKGLDTDIADVGIAGVKHLITLGSPAFADLIESEPMPLVPRAAANLAWLFYTSGTTGRPKGACLSHGNLAAMSLAYLAEVDPTSPGDSIVHAAPMSHGSGLYMMAHVLRGAVNVVPLSGGFEAEEIFSLARHWGRMSLFAAPTMVKRMVAQASGADVTAFRTVVYGGGPMYVEDAIAALDMFGPRLAQIYGQGETPMTITTLDRSVIDNRADPNWRAALGSVGRPFGIVEVIVVDEDGNTVAAGQTGEIVVRGPTVMSGYWNDETATAKALKGGWLHTGDLGVFDANGYLTLKDRSKDVIISGGTNIYPREVEEVLLAHAGVKEVSVIGRPDPEWGEVVVAYVVGDAATADLDALCLGSIARFKRPKHYIFIDALPKNNYGKVVKTELRMRDADAARTLQRG
ncbi:class I adenylate-forming enzyme family protein [Mesorhizobium australafricanum]|uniref:AMP-binding protein n=1 Tax=Mesorhizobium australafricanum TaxID=3072311 RepID=A0ABU4WZ53_9HYPH|nr:AMP-binding protein [Mesorhizobium sp. VK3E]MDX8440270.1 AMP-binding protein [Mesorhizobium sp. VK3E]